MLGGANGADTGGANGDTGGVVGPVGTGGVMIGGGGGGGTPMLDEELLGGGGGSTGGVTTGVPKLEEDELLVIGGGGNIGGVMIGGGGGDEPSIHSFGSGTHVFMNNPSLNIQGPSARHSILSQVLKMPAPHSWHSSQELYALLELLELLEDTEGGGGSTGATGGAVTGGGGDEPSTHSFGSGIQLLMMPLTKMHGPRSRHSCASQMLKMPAPQVPQSLQLPPVLELLEELPGGGGGGGGPTGQKSGSGVQLPPKNNGVKIQGPRPIHSALSHLLKIPAPQVPQSLQLPPVLELLEELTRGGGGGVDPPNSQQTFCLSGPHMRPPGYVPPSSKHTVFTIQRSPVSHSPEGGGGGTPLLEDDALH